MPPNYHADISKISSWETVEEGEAETDDEVRERKMLREGSGINKLREES